MLRSRLLLCFSLLVLAVPNSAGAKDSASPGAELTLEDLFAGRAYTRAIPAWRWRPKHDQLVRTTSRKQAQGRPHRVLVGMNPTDGKTEDLLDLSALEAVVPGKGRARGPKMTWAPSGKALCVGVKGDLVWVDLEQDTRRRLTETHAKYGSPWEDILQMRRHAAHLRTYARYIRHHERGFEKGIPLAEPAALYF